jgi:hypothetical protein
MGNLGPRGRQYFYNHCANHHADLRPIDVHSYLQIHAGRSVEDGILFLLAQVLFVFPSGYLSDLLRLRKPQSFIMSALLAGTTAWWAVTFYHGFSFFGLAVVNFLFGGLWELAYVPWSAFYSEYLEDIDPALQATGWSFFIAMFRFWFASAGFLQPIVAQHYGWAAWIWMVAAGVIIYMLSLVVVPGHWRRPA